MFGFIGYGLFELVDLVCFLVCGILGDWIRRCLWVVLFVMVWQLCGWFVNFGVLLFGFCLVFVCYFCLVVH